MVERRISREPDRTLRRFWTMLAHHQGGLLNVAQLGRNMGVGAKTAQSYIDLLCAAAGWCTTCWT